MERFDCGSSLYVSLARVPDDHSFKLTINLRHEKRHMAYFRVDMPPAALDIMREHAETSSPAGLVAVIQEQFPHVTAAQVRRAWIEITETFWKYDSNQSVSVQRLLADLQVPFLSLIKKHSRSRSHPTAEVAILRRMQSRKSSPRPL
jgi:hypothetical protein